MSDLKYLRDKHCTCCDKRLDTIGKINIRTVNNNIFAQKLNDYKCYLSNKRKLSDKIINIGDIVCKSCITNSNKKLKINESSQSSTNNIAELPSSLPSTSAAQNVSTHTVNTDSVFKVNIPKTINNKNCI